MGSEQSSYLQTEKSVNIAGNRVTMEAAPSKFPYRVSANMGVVVVLSSKYFSGKNTWTQGSPLMQENTHFTMLPTFFSVPESSLHVHGNKIQ